jgi:hypothetical protein
MAVTAAELRAHAKVSETTAPDSVLNQCIATAGEQLKTYVGTNVVPAATMARAELLVANECLQQNLAPNGVLNQSYDQGDGSVPLRIGRDPLSPAYPLLSQYVPPLGFA